MAETNNPKSLPAIVDDKITTDKYDNATRTIYTSDGGNRYGSSFGVKTLGTFSSSKDGLIQLTYEAIANALSEACL